MSFNIDAALAQVQAAKSQSFSAADVGLLPKLGGGGFPANEYGTEVSPVPQIGQEKMLGSEWLAFLRFFKNNFTWHTPFRDYLMFSDKLSAAAMSILAAKNYLKGDIALSSIDGSIVVSQIRPETAYAQSGTATYTWNKSSVTAGWNAAVFTIDLNSSSSGSVILTPQNRVALIILGLADFSASPKILGYQFKENGTIPYGVQYVNQQAGIQNLSVYDLQQALYVGPNKKFTIDFNYAAAGSSIPTLLGLQLSTSDYSTSETS